MVVGDDVGVTILGLVHLQVGVLPGELLAWINRLMGVQRQAEHAHVRKQSKGATREAE